MNANRNTAGSSSLPWWTWILPFFIANLGTWLSLWFKTDPGASLWYLPTALGIVMVYWWGPRVLLGVYLNAVVCAPLWDLPWQSSFLYALPETIIVGGSWLFFIKIVRGKYWLPDLKNVVGFLLFGSITPTFIADAYLVIQLYLLGDIPETSIWDNWRVIFSGDLATQFVIAVPLLMLFTKPMSEKGWTQIKDTVPHFPLLPANRNSPRDILFIMVILGTALIAILAYSIHDLWILYGFLMILIAIRYGVNMAVVGTSWIGILAFLLPVILTGKPGLSAATYGDFVSTNFDILFLCGVTLLTGRAISDLFIEITERGQVESALRRSEEKFKALFESAPVGIAVLDRERKIVDSNPALETIMRINKEGLLSGDHRSRTYIRPDGTPRPFSEWASERAIDENRSISGVETGILLEDSQLIWVQVSAVPLELPDVSAVVITQDITERRQAEEELRVSEELHRVTLSNISDAVFITSDDGNFTYICLNVSIIFGYSPAEVAVLGNIGKLLGDNLFDPAELDTRTEIQNIERRISTKTGTHRVLLVNVKRVSIRGGTVLYTCHDITGRKQAEEELAKRAAQMRALAGHLETVREDERTRIAREIHDEFGQFLTALKMDLAWVSRRLQAGDEKRERLKQASSLVDENVRRVQRIATELRPGLLDDLGLMTALDWQAQEFSKHTGLRCRLNLPEHDLQLNPSLSTSLFRIFQETLTNVARHAGASRVDVSLQEDDQSLLLSIRDNGRGITETQLNDPHSLGLLGLHERVAHWNGTLNIQGEAGKGTTVTVQIPIPPPENGGIS